MLTDGSPLTALMRQFPYPGLLQAIALRPGRGEPVQFVSQASLLLDRGIEGDHFGGRAGSKRQVTLIQAEHLVVVAALMQWAGGPGERLIIEQMAGLLRRNLVIGGLNLLALKGHCFRLGEALLEYTGPCEPCSKMERALGPGGYNALRGHGGITARVLEAGMIRLGDRLDPCSPAG